MALREHAPGHDRVLAHVPHQRIEAVEFFFVANLRDELHFQLAVVQPAGKIEYMHFEQRLRPGHRGPEPEARHGVARKITVNAPHAHRVNPGKWQLVPAHADVRGRKPEPAAQFFARDDAPPHRIGPA